MFIHVPDQNPGRCKNFRTSDRAYGESRRCLLYENTPHQCVFEEDKPLVSPITITMGGGGYTQSPAAPWKSPLDPPTINESEQRMKEITVNPEERTYMVLLLDRSGSMESIKGDMEPSMNKFISEQSELPGKCRTTFARFDTEYEVIHHAVKIKDLPKLELDPRGGTALLDAMGRTLVDARAYVANLPADKHPKYKVAIVVTDGEENSSREWSRDKVFDLVKKMEAEGWQFTYLGTSQDAIAVGASMGFAAASSMTYAGTSRGISNSFGSLSNSVAAYRSATMDTVSYSGADREGAMASDDETTSTPSNS